MHSYFQVSPAMFDWVQVWALALPLKDIQRLVPKPLLRCLGCVVRVFALLEGEPSPQSEFTGKIFIKDLSVLCSVHLSLNPDLSPSPFHRKTSPQHDAAMTMLHRRDGARFSPDVTLGIQAKQFSFSFIRPDNLFSQWSESPLGAFWQTPHGLSCTFFGGVASIWPLCHKGLTGGVLQRWLSFWKVLPSPQRNSGALSE